MASYDRLAAKKKMYGEIMQLAGGGMAEDYKSRYLAPKTAVPKPANAAEAAPVPAPEVDVTDADLASLSDEDIKGLLGE